MTEPVNGQVSKITSATSYFLDNIAVRTYVLICHIGLSQDRRMLPTFAENRDQ